MKKRKIKLKITFKKIGHNLQMYCFFLCDYNAVFHDESKTTKVLHNLNRIKQRLAGFRTVSF